MSIDYSVNSLVTSVKQRTMNASNQNLFTDADMVRIASEELQSVLIPYIESIKGEYFVKTLDTTFVQGQQAYTMPQRATGMKLRDVMLVDFQGNQINLPYINPEDLKSNWAYAAIQFGFYPKDNQIILVLGNLSALGNYQYVRMNYFRRPDTLCTTNTMDSPASGQITAINTGTNEVTLNFVPTTWTTSTLVGVVNDMPPFQSWADSQVITNISGFVLTFSSLPAGMEVGDWVAESNFSPIPEIPVECHRVLETLTSARILQYSGDPAFQVFQAQAEAQKRDLINVLSPRIDGSARKIPLRNSLWGWGR